MAHTISKWSSKSWHWGSGGLSSNRNITPKWITKFPEKPWNWGKHGLSSNPAITLEWIDRYPNKRSNPDGKPWNWKCHGLSRNTFVFYAFSFTNCPILIRKQICDFL